MRTTRQLILNIQPEAEPRFDNFLPGDNLELLMALDALARGELKEAVVYLWGPPGSGRSHLLRATVQEAKGHGVQAGYAAAGEFPEEMPRLLAVDDVETLDAEAQVRLFSLINRAREEGSTLLAAGPAAPAQLSSQAWGGSDLLADPRARPTIRTDLATRLSWGLVFGLRPLNEADRATALRERAAARGLKLADDVVHYLLTHGRRDLPSLLAGIDALDAYSLSLKRPLTVPLVREWMQAR